MKIKGDEEEVREGNGIKLLLAQIEAGNAS